jgi:hypothetical protein
MPEYELWAPSTATWLRSAPRRPVGSPVSYVREPVFYVPIWIFLSNSRKNLRETPVISSSPSISHVRVASKICSATLNDAKYCTWHHSQRMQLGEMSEESCSHLPSEKLVFEEGTKEQRLIMRKDLVDGKELVESVADNLKV